MLVIAHRGSSGVAPENTLAAFRRAVREGAAMIELDVRLSADGIPVVIHDRRLDRVTGVSGAVRERTAAELEKLPVRTLTGCADTGERIPRLATVLRALPRRTALNIEVKTDGDRGRSGLMVQRLGPLLRSAGGKRNILVSSFDHAFLRRLHGELPDLTLGALYDAVRDRGRSPVGVARCAGAVVFLCSRAQLRARWIQAAHGAQIDLLVYGVDSVRHMLALKNRGVDGIITNYPARLRRALSTH